MSNLTVSRGGADNVTVDADEEDSTRVRDALIAILAVAATVMSGAFAWHLLTAAPEPVVATELPAPSTVAPPSSLSPTITRPLIPSSDPGPLGSVDQNLDGIERSVRQSVAPWQSRAIDVITGGNLDGRDFTTDVALLNRVTEAIPDGWTLAPFDTDTVPSPAGDVPVDWAETTQPMRARQLVRPDGTTVGRVLIFAGVSPDGILYVREARNHWNPGAPAEHLAPADTVLVTAVVPPIDGNGGIWFASVSKHVVMLMESAPDIAQQDLVGFLVQWRSSFAGA